MPNTTRKKSHVSEGSHRSGKLPTLRVQIIWQRLEQMEQGKRALEVIVGEMQKDVKEAKTKKEKESYGNTWENNSKPESQDPLSRVTAMHEKSKLEVANQKSKKFLEQGL